MTSLPRSSRFRRHSAEAATDNTDPRVCLYMRASTEEQTLTLDAQARTGRDYAQRQDLTIAAEFTETASACKKPFLERAKTKAMLKTMKKEGMKTIVVLCIDRAFRSVHDCCHTLSILGEQGIHFLFIQEALDFTTPSGRLMMNVIVSFAEFEAATRSARQCRGFEEMRAKRIIRNNNPPYGWKAVDDPELTTRAGRPTKRLVPIPREQATLRKIQAYYESCKNFAKVARDLNEQDIPTKKAGETITRNGKPHLVIGKWQALTVQKVLQHADLATEEEIAQASL